MPAGGVLSWPSATRLPVERLQDVGQRGTGRGIDVQRQRDRVGRSTDRHRGHGSPAVGAERHGRQCLDRLSGTARWHEGLITDRDREHGGRRPGTQDRGVPASCRDRRCGWHRSAACVLRATRPV